MRGRLLLHRVTVAALLRITLLTLIGAAAMPVSAAAGWSAPVTVSAQRVGIGELRLAAGPRAQLATWTYSDGAGAGGASEAVAVSGATFGPERPLPHGVAGANLVDLGGGRVAQLILRSTGRNTSSVSVSIGNTNGVFAAALRVPASPFAARAVVAGDARGDLLVAWISADAHGSHRKVWVSVRRPGGRFSRARLLDAGANAEHVSASVGAHADMVVAYASKRPRGRLFARVRRSGHVWAPAQNLGPAAVGNETDVTPLVTASGEVAVAWYHTQLCEGGCESAGFTRIALRPAGSSRFSGAQLLERDPIALAGAPAGLAFAPVLLARPHAAPLVVFLARAESLTSSSLLGPATVKVAVPTGVHYGAPLAISPAGQWAADIAASAGTGAGAIITWIRQEPPSYFGGTVFAARGALSTGLFGAPEQVSPIERAFLAVPAASLPATVGAGSIAPWTVVWASRPTLEEPIGKPVLRTTAVRTASG